MKIFRKLLKVILWVIALWIVFETLDFMRRFNFAKEVPELLWYQWTWLHWIFLIASSLIVLIWGYIRTASHTRPVTGLRLYFFCLVPLAAVTALLLPSVLAAPKVYFQTEVLDCGASRIRGYVPDMVDYTWLVLDNLTRGATLGLVALHGKCVARPDSPFANWLLIAVWVAAAGMSVLTLYGLCKTGASTVMARLGRRQHFG